MPVPPAGWACSAPDPFVVVRLVDHSDHHLATGLVLHTALGESEIPEVWLTLADEPPSDGGTSNAMPVTAAGNRAFPQGR
jgi:hypothetical protein